MDTPSRIEHLKNWGIKGSLSILDQGLYSGTNFVLSVLLARWLLPSQYGAFSIAFAVYLFTYQIHNSIIIEPMSVLGPINMHHRLTDYLRDQIKLHFVVGVLGGLIIIVVGLVILVFNQVLGQAVSMVGIVLSFMLLPLLLRRGFYLFQKPQLALYGSVVYAIFLTGGLWITTISTGISINAAFLLFGLAGLASGIFLLKKIPSVQSISNSISATWSSNWKYGKWLVYSSLLIALAAQAQTFVVGAMLGLSDAGAFRALQNFVQPVILLFAAISALALPSLSYDFGKGNTDKLKRKGRYLFALFLLVSLCFEILLLIYGSALETIIYDGKFLSYAHLIPLWGLVPIAGTFTYVYYFLLQSIQRPKAILIGSTVWSATSAILSVVLSIEWGIVGATISVVLGYLFSGIAFGLLYRYYISESNGTRRH
jgi:O-antigen/teichoic acid export membrane protein